MACDAAYAAAQSLIFAAVAFDGGTFAFDGGTFTFDGGTFTFFFGGAAWAGGVVTLAPLLDDIVSGRAIDAGECVGIVRQPSAQLLERGLEVAVVSLHADAKASRDFSPFPALDEGFEDDLALHPRRFGQMTNCRSRIRGFGSSGN